MKDGKCIEILYLGSFDEEPISFRKMGEFSKGNGLQRIGKYHREIYMSHANRVEKSNLKTILLDNVK